MKSYLTALLLALLFLALQVHQTDAQAAELLPWQRCYQGSAIICKSSPSHRFNNRCGRTWSSARKNNHFKFAKVAHLRGFITCCKDAGGNVCSSFVP